MNALIATTSLILAVASVLSIATIIFAPFLLGAFVLALAGALSDEDRRVREHRPRLEPRGWREA